jgi:CHAT domain-containing protein/tetratricopeptide (TPR) repeat protein
MLDSADSARVADLNGKIVELRSQARYAEAVGPAEEAVRIRRTAQGDHHWETGDAIRLLATLKHVASLSPEAQIRLAEADRSDDDVRRLFSNGDYDSTAVAVRTSLAIRREILGDNHIEVAIAIDDLATVLFSMGDLARAEPLFRHALLVGRERLGHPHPGVARLLNNLGATLLRAGDPAEAEPFLREALEVNRALLGGEHSDVATCLNNLGMVLHAHEDYRGAEQLLREALDIRRELFQTESPELAVSLINMGILLLNTDDYAGAEQLLRDALAIYDLLYGRIHFRVAAVIHQLADLHALQGCVAEAESLYDQALDINLTLFGATHPNVVRNRIGLARSLSRQGKVTEGVGVWRAAAESFEIARLRIGTGGMERVRFSSRQSPLVGLSVCLARLYRYREAWEQLENSLARGLLDELAVRFKRPLSHEEQQQEYGLINRLSTLDEQLGLTIAFRETTSEYAGYRDSLRLERERTVTELARFQSELDARHGVAVGAVFPLERIQRSLRSDEALVAWVDTRVAGGVIDSTCEHWACVLRRDGDPVWIGLPGRGADGEWTTRECRLVEELRASLSLPPNLRPTNRLAAMAEELCEQRLAPLYNELSDVTHVIMLPGSQMAGIPLEILTDRYTFSYAPSATVSAWIREKQRALTSGGSRPSEDRIAPLLAIGDPMLSISESTGVATNRPGLRRTDAFQTLQPLPGARDEVENIAALFMHGDSCPETMMLLGEEARERRIAALAVGGDLQKFGFLHIATHAVMNDRDPLRSALVLSGDEPREAFELALQGSPVFDGQITAEQIMRTWKLDAELVTLSACESGLGRESGGEGFLGFSQALFLAGARSLVLSLWQVEDTATTLLMTRFYENLLGAFDTARVASGYSYEPGTPLPKAAALEEARNWLRDLTWHELDLHPIAEQYVSRGLVPVDDTAPVERSERPFADPHYWAAFILMGDPR